MVTGMRGGAGLFLVAILLSGLVSYPVHDVDIDRNIRSYSEQNLHPTLLLNHQDGAVFSNNTTLSGTVWDDEFPDQLYWEISSMNGELAHGSAIDTLTENLSWPDPSSKSWEFTIPLNVSDYGGCSCQLAVLIIDANQQTNEIFLLFFIDDGVTNLMPNLMIQSPTSSSDWRGDLEVSGAVVSSVGYQPTVEWSITRSNQAEYFCDHGILSDLIDIQNWLTIDLSYPDNGHFNINIDSTDFEDGWWLISARAGDNSGNYSAISCIAIAIHNEKPIANLTGSTELNESELARFDASNSDDPFWGKDGLRFTFIIRLEGETNPPTVHDVGAAKQLNWVANRSGTFEIMVLVTDSSGLSNSSTMSLIVHNIAPKATATIEGIRFGTDEVIKLPDEEFWIIDASDSTDTINDYGGLSFVWYVDGEPVSLGREQILRREWLKDDSIPHLITMSVTDDDGQSDYTEVIIGIEGTKSDPDYIPEKTFTSEMIDAVGGDLNMAFIFMIILSIIAVSTMKITKSERENQIPKWIPKIKKGQSTDAVEEEFESEISD